MARIQNHNKPKNISDESIRLIASPSRMAKRAFLYVLEIGYIEAELPFFEEADHLDAYLLVYTVSGEGKVVYEDKTYMLKQNDIFLIDCKKYHYCSTKESEQGWKFLYFYFNGFQAKDYYDLIINHQSPVFQVEISKTIMSIFWQMIELQEKKNRYAEILTSMHMTRMLTEIFMLYANMAMLEVERPDYINRIFFYINNNYKEKITLDMLSEKYAVNKFHLAKEFKRYAGTTVNEYVINNRMNKAKALLRYSDKSVDVIACEVGFYNASHFIKMFREREHITPLLYRKQWK